MECNICSSPTKKKFSKIVLGTYNVTYFQCKNCYFIQTENPYWLDEAYNDAITKLDLGLVSRNQALSNITPLIIKHASLKEPYLDFAGGYGLFVRLMRDKGFNFYREDKYCKNIFAENFDLSKCEFKNFNLVTAFEVFEHLDNPLISIEQMLSYSKNIFFSTELIPDKNVEDWWYIQNQTGQHISFYHINTLKHIANKLNLNLYSNKNFHLLTNKNINPYIYKLVTNSKVASFLDFIGLHKNKSLLQNDYNAAMQSL